MTTPGDGAPVAFEDSVRRLAAIVEQIERGDLPLDKTIELFEEGMRIARQARSDLDKAEKRVEELLAVEADGTPVTRDLPP